MPVVLRPSVGLPALLLGFGLFMALIAICKSELVLSRPSDTIANLFEPHPFATPTLGSSTWGLVSLVTLSILLIVLRSRHAFRPSHWRRF